MQAMAVVAAAPAGALHKGDTHHEAVTVKAMAADKIKTKAEASNGRWPNRSQFRHGATTLIHQHTTPRNQRVLEKI